MLLQDFEKKLKSLNPDLRIVPHPSNKDMAGIYFREAFVCGIPSHHINEEKTKTYTNMYGDPHASIPETMAKIKGFFMELDADKDFYKIITEKQ